MAKASMLGQALEQAFGAEKERVSFTISAELYEEFADYAAEKQVSMAAVFRDALSDFAAYKFMTPEREAELTAAMLADAQAVAALPEVPKQNGNEWMN